MRENNLRQQATIEKRVYYAPAAAYTLLLYILYYKFSRKAKPAAFFIQNEEILMRTSVASVEAK